MHYPCCVTFLSVAKEDVASGVAACLEITTADKTEGYTRVAPATSLGTGRFRKWLRTKLQSGSFRPTSIAQTSNPPRSYTEWMLRCAITDRFRFPGDAAARETALLQQADRLGVDGVDFLQLREKDLEPAALAALTRKLLAILRARSPVPRLLLNSRADVAAATAADGVHLTSAEGELTPGDVRRLYAAAGLPEPIVSMSCHTLAEVARARGFAPSLILFGPVFEKVVANPAALDSGEALVAAGSGVNLLRLACAAAAPTRVLALGGITPENTDACLAAGAAGIAGIRLFLG
jgi:thiamine-phosphate pyrophosphorylase